MDNIIGSLLSRLQQAGILDKMNVIIVSDHGNRLFKCKIFYIKFKVNVWILFRYGANVGHNYCQRQR